jgi:regulatory protein
MIKVEKLKVNTETAVITTNQGSLTVLTDDYLNDPLHTGQLLTVTQWDKWQQAALFAQGWRLAVRRLSRTDRSVKEVYQMLDTVENLGQPAKKQIVMMLSQRGYLDDDRLIAELIAQYTQRGYGPRKIKYEMTNRGLDAANVEQQLADVKTEVWIQAASDIAVRYLAGLKGLSGTARKRKTAQKLLACGYDRSISDDIISRLDYDNDDETEQQNLKQAAEKAYRHYGRTLTGAKLRQAVYRYLSQQGYHYEQISMVLKESRNDDEQ